MDNLLQLYPQPVQEIPFSGAYLAQDVRREAKADQVFIYANFVVSLDGRIAIPHPSGKGLTVPKQIANERDWRLFQELAGQADLIISSGRYLREWAEGRAQEILQIDDPRFADIRDWRQARGLKPQPDIAIISGSLRFPIPPVLTAGGRSVVVFTTSDPDPARVAQIEAQAGRVYAVGATSVDGALLAQKMAALGYRSVYSAAGPQNFAPAAGGRRVKPPVSDACGTGFGRRSFFQHCRRGFVGNGR